MTTPGSRERNWKGDVPLVLEEQKHRWQSDVDPSTPKKERLHGGRRLIPTIGLASALLFTGILVYLLSYAPVKTPVLAICAGQYNWPIPLPAWRMEDFSELEKLHGKTIHWVNASREWHSRTEALADLERRASSLASQAARSGACIVYVAMQGGVNDAGNPCLIPTQGDALDPNTWIGIDEIADVLLSAIPAKSHCLLVIDPIDLSPNWHAGVLSQTFTFRLTEWMEKSDYRNLSILIAGKDGQEICSAPELKGTLFGREFRLGLAGGADAYAPTNASDSVNRPGDGIVTAHELAKFVSSRVQSWSKEFRKEEQTPLLLSKSPKSSAIVWASLADEKSRQLDAILTSTLPTPAVSSSDMASLWDIYHQLKDENLYLDNPSRWAEMEFNLVRLEDANRSGMAFSDLVKRQLYPQTKRLLELYLERARGPHSKSLFEREQFLASTTPPVARSGPWPSLTLKRMFGEIGTPQQEQLAVELPNLLASDGLVDFEWISNSAQILPSGSVWNEVNFVNLLKRYGGQSMAATASQLQEVLELHLQIEQMAVGEEIRTARVQAASMAPIDRLRRRMEDLAFAGDSDAITQAIQELRQAIADRQSNTANIANLADRAIRVRDRFLVTSPHILAWLNANHSLDDATESQDSSTSFELKLPSEISKSSSTLSNRKRAAIDRFLQLLSASAEFTQLLTDRDGSSEQRFEKMRESADLLVQDWNFLEEQWNLDATGVLAKKERAALVLSELGTELQVLVRDSEIRKQLRQLESEAQELAHSTNRTHLIDSLKSNWKENAIPSGGADAFVLLKSQNISNPPQHWDTWGDHPFLTYLNSSYRLQNENTDSKENPAKSLDEDADRLERGNRHLRNAFNAFPAFTPSRILSWCRGAGIQLKSNDTISAWDTAVYADYVERVLSPWSARRTDTHGFSLFKNLATKEILGWYANRSLDDFYATRSLTSGIPPFFELAVQQILRNIERIPAPSVEQDEFVADIKKRLSVLVGTYRQALVIDVKSNEISSDDSAVPASLTVRPNRIQVPGGGEWEPELPSGIASAYRKDNSGTLSSLHLAVPVPRGSEPTRASLGVQSFETAAASSELIVVFRGHEYAKDMKVGNYTIVEYNRERSRQSEVVLFGDKPKQPSIVFVLDCSSSMGEPIPLESIDSRTQSKLEAAKAGISQLLDQLATFPDARVGVRLFGHRIGWSRPAADAKPTVSTQSRLLLQPNYSGRIPDGLTPSRDIEKVLSLGRFNSQLASELSNRLSTVAPWGQSPVYLSIIEAYSDFDADSESTAKCVVVITDGDNFQFNSVRSPGGDREVDTSLSDVFRAWEQRKIPTFILGVGIESAGNANVLNNLKSIADGTGGAYYDVQSRTDLLRALMDQLSKGEYRVANIETGRTSARISESAEVLARLNTPIQLDLGTNLPQRYEIAFQNIRKEFEVFGGESLEMMIQESGQDLQAEPYLVGSPKTATMRKMNSAERRLARVHRPVKDAESVVFPISLQNPNSHYTKRPQELWIEIQAQGSNKENLGKPYVFNDLPWKSGVPVPLVDCRAVDWPSNATRASIRLWFADLAPVPLLSVPVVDLVSNAAKYAQNQTIPAVPGYSVQLNVQQDADNSTVSSITVKEFMASPLSDVNQTKIRITAKEDAMPSWVRHKFDHGGLANVHSFQFDSKASQRIGGSTASKVEVLVKGNIISGGWGLEDELPIEIEIMESSDYISAPSIVLP